MHLDRTAAGNDELQGAAEESPEVQTTMVTVLSRPAVLDITAQEEIEIYDLLRTRGAMSPDEVASVMRLDEGEVALYLANQAGLGAIHSLYGRYSTWHWL
jgi:hypothetical protein